MKKNFLYTTVAAGLMLAGCSAAYRTAQTPDDLYYSEGPANTAMVQNTRGNQANQRQEEGYASYWETQDDDYLRMKVRDRDRWGAIDDIDYWQGYNNNMWVNYNTFNSPFGFNSWNNPMMMGFNRPFGMSPWNQPFGYGHGWGWNSMFNNPWGMGMGMNRGFGMGMGMGFNQFGFGMNSWNNNWNNPMAWNQPMVIINKYPTRLTNNPSRSGSTLSPYRNNSFNNNRSNAFSSGNRNASPSRSIWETPAANNSNNRATYRNVERPGVDGSNRTFERPTRTFNTGGNTNTGGGATRSTGSGTSSGSAGSSSRGGRGG